MAKTKSKSRQDPEEPQVRMTFGEHLDELRKRIVRALFGSIAGIVVCLLYVNQIVQFLVHPLRVTLHAHGLPDVMQYSKPAEPVITYLTLAIQVGLIVSSPWIIFQLWQFVGAGLFPRERRIVYRYVGPSVVLFLLGVLFLFFIVLPMTLNFVVGFTDNTAGPPPKPTWIEDLIIHDIGHAATLPATLPAGDAEEVLKNLPRLPMVSSDPPPPADGVAYLYYNGTDEKVKLRTGREILTVLVVRDGSLFMNIPRLDDYLGFVMFAALVFGVAFEMPMVILVLSQIGIVRVRTWGRIRKYAYFAILILAAVIAPTSDPFTMMFLAVPLVLLYEAGIVTARMVVGKQPEEDSEDEDEPSD